MLNKIENIHKNVKFPKTSKKLKQMQNQFLIDLNSLTLSKKQLKSINDAIEKAVAAELSKIDTIGKVAILPLPKEDEHIVMYRRVQTWGFFVDVVSDLV